VQRRRADTALDEAVPPVVVLADVDDLRDRVALAEGLGEKPRLPGKLGAAGAPEQRPIGRAPDGPAVGGGPGLDEHPLAAGQRPIPSVVHLLPR
jgi:hypothetical protein